MKTVFISYQTMERQREFKPKNILLKETLSLRASLLTRFHPLHSFFSELCDRDWVFYAVDQDRGRCYYDYKVITIPVHAFQSSAIGYLVYYIAHEMSHAFAGPEAGHGPLFMQQLKRICPAEYQHYETGYKIKQAILSGIVPDDF